MPIDKRQAGILLLSIALHLIVYMAWFSGGPLPAPAPLENGKPVAFLVIIPTQKAPSAQQSPVATSPAATSIEQSPRRHSRPVAPQTDTAVATPEPRPDSAAEAAMTLVDKAAPGPAPVQDLRGLAKGSVGTIDRELRHGAGAGPALKVTQQAVYQGSRLEKSIAAAYIDRSPPKQEELVLDDGRRVTRIGNICYTKDTALRPRGRDQIQNGSPTFAFKCWQVGLPMR
jgi:hypothetical protein